MALPCNFRIELSICVHHFSSHTHVPPASVSPSILAFVKLLPAATSCDYVARHRIYITQRNPPINSDKDENRGPEFVGQRQLYILCIFNHAPAILVNVKSMFVFAPLFICSCLRVFLSCLRVAVRVNISDIQSISNVCPQVARNEKRNASEGLYKANKRTPETPTTGSHFCKMTN